VAKWLRPKYRLCKRLNKCGTYIYTLTHAHIHTKGKKFIYVTTADRHIYIKYTLSWVCLSLTLLKSMLHFL